MGGGSGQQGGAGSQISAYMSQGIPQAPTGFGSGVTMPGGFIGAAPSGLTQMGPGGQITLNPQEMSMVNSVMPLINRLLGPWHSRQQKV